MPRRKALLIGINYFGTEQELAGCINDAQNVREFLVQDRGWPDGGEDMLILTDDPENEGTQYWPGMENVKAAIRWLVTGNEEGDSCWLSYSGHGGAFPGSPERDK
jgi:metacaspase-1